MFQCPSCGSAVSPQAHTCPHCGHPLRETSGQQLAGCGLGVLGFMGFLLASSFMKTGKVGWVFLGLAIVGGLVYMASRQDRL